MLKLRGCSISFFPGTINEKRALKEVDLTLKEGDFVTIIGGNGAGKSTLLNIIAGVYPVSSGSIEIAGVDITNMSEFNRAQYIGRVFQDPMMGTAADMTIEENMAMAKRRGMSRSAIRPGIVKKTRAEFKAQLEKLDLGLEDRLLDQAGLLSGGQRQAITLLMATLRRPDLLLLDEHTAALDPKTASKVLQLTQKIVDEQKLTALMVTHNMRDALAYGNRLVMFNHGRIILDIASEEKKHLTVEDLMQLFNKTSGSMMVSDRMLLS